SLRVCENCSRAGAQPLSSERGTDLLRRSHERICLRIADSLAALRFHSVDERMHHVDGGGIVPSLGVVESGHHGIQTASTENALLKIDQAAERLGVSKDWL